MGLTLKNLVCWGTAGVYLSEKRKRSLGHRFAKLVKRPLNYSCQKGIREHGRMASVTEVLEWKDTGSLGMIGKAERRGYYPPYQ